MKPEQLKDTKSVAVETRTTKVDTKSNIGDGIGPVETKVDTKSNIGDGTGTTKDLVNKAKQLKEIESKFVGGFGKQNKPN